MRKQPKQSRSRATVDAIVTAGIQVLGKQGWAGFTTNKVAAIAGVSIGSLYQYFPDKHALIEAIRLRHLGLVLDVMREASAERKPLETTIDALVQGMLAIHDAHPALHRALLEESPHGKNSRTAHDEFESQYLKYYERVLAKHGKRRGTKRIQAGAQILSSAIEGVVHNAALKGQSDSLEWRRELACLIGAYLRV